MGGAELGLAFTAKGASVRWVNPSQIPHVWFWIV